MARNESMEAIVLKVYDVGEADRFCILLTREKGRIAARAKGVRKPKSTMGGLLPLQYAELTVHSGSSGYLITSVRSHTSPISHRNIETFVELQQSTDMLLHLLHDERPMEDVFLMTKEMCVHENIATDAHISFGLRLLEALGMLPHHEEGLISRALENDEREYMKHALSQNWLEEKQLSANGRRRLKTLCEKIISHEVNVPLKSTEAARQTLAV